MYDPSVILNVLVRWDHKIVRSYDPDRDFDNHDLCDHLDLRTWQKKWQIARCKVQYSFGDN